jgi:hypothetical protein
MLLSRVSQPTVVSAISFHRQPFVTRDVLESTMFYRSFSVLTSSSCIACKWWINAPHSTPKNKLWGALRICGGRRVIDSTVLRICHASARRPNTVIRRFCRCLNKNPESSPIVPQSITPDIMAPIKSIEYFRVKPRWLFVKIVDENDQAGWGEGTLEGHTLAVEGALDELKVRLIGLEAK